MTQSNVACHDPHFCSDLSSKLPSYPKICQRKPEHLNASSVSVAPKVEWCVDDTLVVSPTSLAFPSNVTVPTAAVPHCCQCDNMSPVPGEECLSTALCSLQTGTCQGRLLFVRDDYCFVRVDYCFVRDDSGVCQG